MVKSQKQIMEDIKTSFSSGRLVPFIGSGFSKNVEGFRDWKEFIEGLSYKLTKNKYFLNNKFEGYTFQIMAAEYYACRKLLENKGTVTRVTKERLRKTIQCEINEFLGNGQSKPSEIHKMLITMFQYIYTTNWDMLFECQGIEKLTPIYSIGKICELENLKKKVDNKILIKMHGNCDDSESIIALETDYWALINGRHHNLALNLLFQNDILQKDFIFLGFSFSDLNINNLIYLMNEVQRELDITQKNTPKKYMIVFEDYDETLERYYLDLKNIGVLFINDVVENQRINAIRKFLNELELHKLDKTNLKENKNISELDDKKKSIEELITKDEERIDLEYKKYVENKIEILNMKRDLLQRSISILKLEPEKIKYNKLIDEFNEENEKLTIECENLKSKINN
jgi:hypothetical protein